MNNLYTIPKSARTDPAGRDNDDGLLTLLRSLTPSIRYCLVQHDTDYRTSLCILFYGALTKGEPPHTRIWLGKFIETLFNLALNHSHLARPSTNLTWRRTCELWRYDDIWLKEHFESMAKAFRSKTLIITHSFTKLTSDEKPSTRIATRRLKRT